MEIETVEFPLAVPQNVTFGLGKTMSEAKIVGSLSAMLPTAEHSTRTQSHVVDVQGRDPIAKIAKWICNVCLGEAKPEFPPRVFPTSVTYFCISMQINP